MYELRAHGRMIADTVRTTAYAEALERVVPRSGVVVDLGTGTGIFALLAARAGARRVFAIDPSDALELCAAFARDHGWDDRIECLARRSQDVELPERADVIVSDVRGILPMGPGSLSAILDARDRFLEPTGTLVPAVDTLWGAFVESEDAWRRVRSPWLDHPVGLDLRAGHDMMAATPLGVRLEPDCLRSDPRTWARLDYRSLGSPHVKGCLAGEIEAAGTIHGACLWFETELTEGVGFSTGPGCDRIYGQLFLPWTEPVEVARGDRVESELNATAIDDGTSGAGRPGSHGATARAGRSGSRPWMASRWVSGLCVANAPTTSPTGPAGRPWTWRSSG